MPRKSNNFAVASPALDIGSFLLALFRQMRHETAAVASNAALVLIIGFDWL